jgi:hypothetical protein
MTNGLQVISSGLLITNVGVNTGVSGSSSKVFALSKGYMFSIRVLVALSQSEIDDVDLILSLVSASNQEVIRLNVSVDDAFFVDFLNALNL